MAHIVQTIVLRHDAGMFTVKGINRLKILQDAIDRNLHPGQAAEMIDQALCIIREHYRDFGPTLALENLEEVHGLVLGKETIRRLMIKAGIWIPRR